MIKIRGEKGFVTIEDWSDVLDRPRFIGELDPTEKKLADVIGCYIFPDSIRCGLSNCHTPHRRGFLVVTEDGLETNIGKNCGETHFGIDFKTMSRNMSYAVTRQQRKDTVFDYQFRASDILDRIEELRERPRGADWTHRKLAELKSRTSGWPDIVIATVSQLQRTRTGSITKTRAATKREFETAVASGASIDEAKLIVESSAEISGISALYQENDLRYLIVTNAESPLRKLEKLDIEYFSDSELSNWVKIVTDIDRTLDRAEESISSAHLLLEPSNLLQFKLLLENPTDISAFTKKLNSHKQEWES